MASSGTKEAVSEAEVECLFRIAANQRYNPRVPNENDKRIMEYCRILFCKDYDCKVMRNLPRLSAHYPKKIIVPITKNRIAYEKQVLDEGSLIFNAESYRGLAKESQRIRNSKRFPVPTILFKEKFLIRAGSIKENSVSRLTQHYMQKEEGQSSDFSFQINISSAAFLIGNIKFISQMRKDIALLQQLDVQYICDLRVRDPSKDIPQFSHSNSACKQNYEVFKTAHLPYPAITFFSNYHIARNPLIMFDWNLVSPRFEVALPDIDYMTLYQVDFTKYQEWHLVDLTLNYLLVLQTYVTSDSLPKRGGVLLHCVAGQDRTPVFLTLLRLSLWADGLIHEFLTPKEILFFTIAYDWYLFGHDLEKSLDHNWEIMHFCYSILDYVAADRFSVRKSEENGGIACRLNLDPPEETDRKEKLFEVMELFMRFYPLIERPRDHERPPPSQPSPSTERPLS